MTVSVSAFLKQSAAMSQAACRASGNAFTGVGATKTGSSCEGVTEQDSQHGTVNRSLYREK